MFRLFDRYILREILPPFLIGLMVYTFVLLMNQILQLSEMFIARGISFNAVWSLLIYLLPAVLAFTVPMSVLMGILAGMSRMSSDVEITAFKTLGVSYNRMLRPVLFFSLCGWLVTSVLTLYLAPAANAKWIQVFSESVLTKVQFNIQPREFNESIPHTVFYIQDITQDRGWNNIFIYFSQPPEEPRAIYAKSGQMLFFEKEKRAILELFDGTVHSYPREEPEVYRMTSFRQFQEDLNVESFFSIVSEKKRVREKTIQELWRDVKTIQDDFEELPDTGKTPVVLLERARDIRSHWVEIHKKFALPFACFIFAFLGISLGASTRKGGRTSGFTISIVIIIIYYVLITAGEQMAKDGSISPFVGMWGPNIILLLLGLYFFVKSLKESPLFVSLARLWSWRKWEKTAGVKKRLRNAIPRLSLRFPNILDRYVLRKYLGIFALVFFSLLSISIIVTFFERIDNVYEHEKPLTLFIEYIWFRIPEFVHFLLPMAVLTSTLLCLGLLTKSNEVTAMKACGISVYRIVLPVLLLSGVISFVSFYLQENIQPFTNIKADDTWNKINDLPPRAYSSLDRRWVMAKDRNRIYHFQYFDPIVSAFSRFAIYDIDPESWSIHGRMYAKMAYLVENTLSMNQGWRREFAGNRSTLFEEKDHFELAVEEDQSYFLRAWKVPDQMTFHELQTYISQIQEQGFETVRFQVDLRSKISFPLASLVMALIGIPFAFTMGKRGALVGIGLSIIIAMVYWGAIGIFKSLGYIGSLSPFLAAWGPALIFGGLGLYFVFTVRT